MITGITIKGAHCKVVSHGSPPAGQRNKAQQVCYTIARRTLPRSTLFRD
jgi:hypothetical protein